MIRGRMISYLILWPAAFLVVPLLIVVASLAGPILGLAFIVFGLIGVGLSAVFGSIDGLFRQTRIRQTAEESPGARARASELGFPMLSALRPPGAQLAATIVLGEGTCPLLRKKGDVWKVYADGRLSAPLCSPSAAAVERLIRNQGYRAGSSQHCVCPLGAQSVTYLVTAA